VEMKALTPSLMKPADDRQEAPLRKALQRAKGPGALLGRRVNSRIKTKDHKP
jgi:hypothetical protein